METDFDSENDDQNLENESLSRSDDEEEDEEDDINEFMDQESESQIIESNNMLSDFPTKKSIYMMEKSKKKALKDGKTQRKDKGKSRFTAYMLWSKEIRQDMLNSKQDTDFSSISKKLGEMWANVPSAEKYSWKKRAKRLAAKGKTLQTAESGKPANSVKFINKGTPGRKPKNMQPQQTQQKKQQSTEIESIIASVNSNSKNLTNLKNSISANLALGSTGSGSINNMTTTFKSPAQEPADVAAYLKLLGDSLTIIGERLKEHEGQITVSGSLSVLLDSILCSVGPLMCLTNHIPVLAEQPNDTKEKLSNILDNIAYIMPGL